MKKLACFTVLAALLAGLAACGRFDDAKSAGAHAERIIVISQTYNEIIWDLGAQQDVVGVDFSIHPGP